MTVRVVPSPIGALRIREEDGAVAEIAFVDEADGSQPPTEAASTLLLEEAARQLEAYFAGALQRFDLPLAPDGTPFQKRVWDKLDAIAFGVTRTYQDIADELATSARPVGGANGKNPIAIVLPCHRVIGAVGLVGYGGGLWRKRWLLAHEGALPEDRQRSLL